jgi:hypothetical protein
LPVVALVTVNGVMVKLMVALSGMLDVAVMVWGPRGRGGTAKAVLKLPEITGTAAARRLESKVTDVMPVVPAVVQPAPVMATYVPGTLEGWLSESVPAAAAAGKAGRQSARTVVINMKNRGTDDRRIFIFAP